VGLRTRSRLGKAGARRTCRANSQETTHQTKIRPCGAGNRKLTGQKPYRVLIADDHSVVRRGLEVLLGLQPGIEVCGEAVTGTETIEQVRRHKPDLVILDLTMPELNGIEVSKTIKREYPDTSVLVLSMHFSEEVAREVLRSGALGYVLKSDADSDLLSAVDHMRHHQPFFTGRLALTMAQNFVDGNNDEAGAHGALPGSPLTGRELQVVTLLAEGKSNKEVAWLLNVSTRTIESHRNHIMHKMNFTSFSDLIRYAVRNDLVAP